MDTVYKFHLILTEKYILYKRLAELLTKKTKSLEILDSIRNELNSPEKLVYIITDETDSSEIVGYIAIATKDIYRLVISNQFYIKKINKKILLRNFAAYIYERFHKEM